MTSWGDLSWREKKRVEAGQVDPYGYSLGYTFDVKVRVSEGQRRRRAYFNHPGKS